jgi:dienelactone hydrolase
MARRTLVLVAALAMAGCVAPEGAPADQAVQGAAVPSEPILTPVGPTGEVPPPPAGEASGKEPASARPPGLYALRLQVDGEEATGLVAVPQGVPTTLVLVAHGWGGDAALHRPDLEAMAAHGALAAAMDFRGPTMAFKVMAGVADTNAAALALQREYPEVDRTMVYGWSMGGEVALLAPLAVPPGTYDYVFSGAGVMDLTTFWHEWPLARPAIENETGGTPAEASAAYGDRSPEVRAGAIAQRGLARVFLVQAAADSTVPLEHAERVFAALQEAGQPVSYYVVTKDRTDVCLVSQCQPQTLPAGHDAGQFRLLRPFIEHRIDRLPDPAQPAVRGTYDGETGEYDPSDVG